MSNNTNSQKLKTNVNNNSSQSNSNTSLFNSTPSNSTPSNSTPNNTTPSTPNNTPKNSNVNSRTLAEKASNKISVMYKSARNTVQDRIQSTTGIGDDTFVFISRLVLTVLVLVAIFYIAKYYYNKYNEMVYNSPYLLDGIKNAKRSLVISQDPRNAGYIPITRSEGQDGIQFTYDFWLLIETFDYKPGQWKHVFHKGNASGYPNRAPGVWLHPSTNAIRFYMNTQENILEYIDVDNIPGRKWLHFSLVLDDKDMDIYVNGFLKARKKLSSVPKQNNGDFWCNMFGGFEGYMARMRYYARAITPQEILDNVRKGPGSTKCLDDSDVPAYFDDNWWYDV